jgi:predicted MFS family arabinose efflux permease
MIQAVASAYREAFRGLPREAWYLALAMLVNRSGSMVLPFLALYVNKELGYSPGVAATMVAVFGVGSSVGTFLGGYATERWGPIRVLIGALWLNALGFVALSRMPDYATFAVTLFAISAVGEAFRPANMAALTLFCEAGVQKRAIALNRLALNLGFSIGPVLGGFLASFSYQWLFWLDAATCAAAALVLYVLLGHHHAELKRRVSVASGGPRENPFLDLPFMLFVLLAFVSFSAFFQLMSTYPLFLADEFHLVEWQIGIILAINTIIVCVCEMVLVHRIDHWNPIRTIGWGACLMCVGFGILPFGYGFAFAAAGVLVWTLGEMLMMPLAMAYVAAYSDEQSRGRYIGVYTTAASLAFVAGPLLASWCYARDHFLGWYVSLGIGVIVLFGFYALEPLADRRTRTQQAQPTTSTAQ